MKKYINFIFYILLFYFVSSNGFELVILEDDYKYINSQSLLSSPYYELIDEIGKKGDGDGEFFFPQGLSIDDFGRLYVADTENNRISVWRNREFLYNIADSGKIQAIRSIPGTDRILISDSKSYSINILFRDGYKIMSYGGKQGFREFNFSFPNGVFFDRHYNIFVTDRLNDNIKKIDRFSNIVREYSKSGLKRGALNQPVDIYVNRDDEIYVVNHGNDRVDVFSSDFDFLFSIGERGSNPTQFRGPYGISGDSEDNIYVCDQFNGRIQKFDKNGILSAVIGKGILKQPRFVTVDASGIVYASDVELNKVMVFSPDMFGLGRTSLIEGDYEKAVKFFEYALKIDKNNINSYYYTAYSFYKLNNYAKVKEILSLLELISPESRSYELTKTLVNKIEKWGR
ncbi:MAG: hypothetical protein WC002_00450 [Candidatus Muiribacteriota bacterium]